jgi:hypothetical protein
MEADEAEFQQSVTSAIAQHDSEALIETINKRATYCEKDVQSWELFPERIFQFLVELLTQDRVVEFEGTYDLFLIFRHEWSRLSDLQRERLLALLGDVYRKPMAEMTRFVICELLGEFYANAEALALLKRFGKMQSEESRLFVPHGLEHLIEETADPDIRAAAIDVFGTFEGDASERVREEALAAANAIGNRFKK